MAALQVCVLYVVCVCFYSFLLCRLGIGDFISIFSGV